MSYKNSIVPSYSWGTLCWYVQKPGLEKKGVAHFCSLTRVHGTTCAMAGGNARFTEPSGVAQIYGHLSQGRLESESDTTDRKIIPPEQRHLQVTRNAWRKRRAELNRFSDLDSSEGEKGSGKRSASVRRACCLQLVPTQSWRRMILCS